MESEVQYEAGKEFMMNGVTYKRGDPVPTEELDDRKVGQLLNQRFLQPSVIDPDKPKKPKSKKSTA